MFKAEVRLQTTGTAQCLKTVVFVYSLIMEKQSRPHPEHLERL